MTQPFVSYAQHGEDVILWRALGGGAPRFYVDVGAFDPTDDSVTRALYERGWRGINIEPQPDGIAAFERDRPEDVNLCIAVGASDGTGTLHVPAGAPWATLDETAAGEFRAAGVPVVDIDVPVRTLASIFAEYAIDTVDVLKVDVEGSEPAVLQGLDLDRVQPTIIVVEGYAPYVGRGAGDEAVDMLVAAGYVHCMFDGLNHYLTCDPSLVDALSLPANPTDAYIPAAKAAIAAYEAERLQLLATIERLDPPPPTPIAEILRRYPAAQVASAEIVLRRRRVALTRLLVQAQDLQNLVDWAAPVTADAAQELTEIIALRDQEQVISGIYRVVLRREADADGLASWLDVLRSGVAPIEVARLMAASPEVVGRGDAHENAIVAVVEAAASRAALRDLRYYGLEPTDARRADGATRALTVYAVFDACLGRAPSPTELASETARLAGGLGRDRLIAAYARHPEAWRRMIGPLPEGFAGKVVRRIGHRRVMSVARSRVAAAEIRRMAEMGMIASAIPDGDADRDRESEGGEG